MRVCVFYAGVGDRGVCACVRACVRACVWVGVVGQVCRHREWEREGEGGEREKVINCSGTTFRSEIP